MLRKLRRVMIAIACLAVVAYAGLRIANYFLLQTVANRILEEDSRLQGLIIKAHYLHYADYRYLVVDYKAVGPPAGPSGVFRSFFQLAREFVDTGFEVVILAYRGVPRFKLDGDTFMDLGEDYGQVKVMELVARFGSNLRFLNGDLVLAGRAGQLAAKAGGQTPSGGREEDNEAFGEILSSFVTEKETIANDRLDLRDSGD